MSTIPKPGCTLMGDAGLQSYGQLAERANIPKSTVYAAFTGRRRNIHPATIAGLAKALRVSDSKISQALGMGALEEGVDPYEPPSEAALLSAREREAVDEIIRLLVQARRKPMKLGQSRLDETRLADEADTYVADTENKLRKVKQQDYTPAAKNHDEEEN